MPIGTSSHKTIRYIQIKMYVQDKLCDGRHVWWWLERNLQKTHSVGRTDCITPGSKLDEIIPTTHFLNKFDGHSRHLVVYTAARKSSDDGVGVRGAEGKFHRNVRRPTNCFANRVPLKKKKNRYFVHRVWLTQTILWATFGYTLEKSHWPHNELHILDWCTWLKIYKYILVKRIVKKNSRNKIFLLNTYVRKWIMLRAECVMVTCTKLT